MLIAAHLVPVTVLPSGVWRVILGFGVPMGFSRAAMESSGIPGWGTAYMLALTLLTEVLALLTLGLVRPWGEVVPGWVPRLGGRRIPVAAVTMPAVVGGLLLTTIWGFAILGLFTGRTDHFTGGSGWFALLVACYLPALAWGPLLLWVTYHYHRRRRTAQRT